jgi:hypothetical protein
LIVDLRPVRAAQTALCTSQNPCKYWASSLMERGLSVLARGLFYLTASSPQNDGNGSIDRRIKSQWRSGYQD